MSWQDDPEALKEQLNQLAELNRKYSNAGLKNKLRQNENARIRINSYKESIKDFLKQFRDEVIKDFRYHRKIDRSTKKGLIISMLIFFTFLFLTIIFVTLAFIFGWGISENFTDFFRLTFVGIMLTGAVSFLTIIFKYIFNKKEDIFYKYSVDLYQHIVNETSILSDIEEYEDFNGQN